MFVACAAILNSQIASACVCFVADTFAQLLININLKMWMFKFVVIKFEEKCIFYHKIRDLHVQFQMI